MLNLQSNQSNRKDGGNRSSQNPKILEVDLIRGEMPASFDLKRHAGTLFISLIITALFVVEIYLGLNWWSDYESSRLEKSQQRFTAISEEIKKMNASSEQINSFKDRVALADSILTNHIYWTNFFNWLEANTLSSVTYEGFSGTNDGEYELEGTTKAYRDISWQARVFLADPHTISASIDEGSSATNPGQPEEAEAVTDISFSLNLKVDPKIFKINSLDK